MAKLFTSGKDTLVEFIGLMSGDAAPDVTTAGNYISFLQASNNVKQTDTRPSTKTPVYGGADISSSGYSSFSISGDVYVYIDTGSVTTVVVTDGGSGYTSAPTVAFTSGGGSGAAATAIINPATGEVTRVWVTAGGSSYETAPTVGFSGGAGTGATATAVINQYSDAQLELLKACDYLAIRVSPYGTTADSNKPYYYGTISPTQFNYEFPASGPIKISIAGDGNGSVTRGEW